MWNLTAAELSSGTVALSTGHVQCAGKTGANKMYKVNSTAVLDLVFTPPRRLMRVELAEFGANDVGQVTASPAAKRAVLTVMLNFAETDVSAQIRSAYGRYRFAGVDVSSDFSVSALELMPASSDAQATDRPASDSISADTGDDGGFPWWAIVIIVIGALVFGAGVGLVVFRSIKQRKEDDGAAHNAAASSAARQSEAATSTELGAVTAHDRASVVSSTSTAANYQSLQEVEQYHDLHLKDDDTPDAELEETSAGTVKAKVGHYQKADMAGPGHHYDKIHPEAFKNN